MLFHKITITDVKCKMYIKILQLCQGKEFHFEINYKQICVFNFFLITISNDASNANIYDIGIQKSNISYLNVIEIAKMFLIVW